MLRILGNSKQLCNQITRRDLLQAGGLGLGGLGLADLLAVEGMATSGEAAAPGFGKAKSVIVLFLYGAWSQLDTFDMKPNAPSEIRGEFNSIATSVPGLRICEHLPKTAKIMDRLTLVRSLTHSYPTHCVAYALSGIPKNPLRDPRDYWPFYGSTLDYLWSRDPGGVTQPRGIPRQMCLPWLLNSHSTNRSHRGLTSAWLGPECEPILGEFKGRATRERGHPSAKGSKAVRSHFDPFDGVSQDSTFQLTAETITKPASRVTLPHETNRTQVGLPHDVTVDRMNRRRTLLQQFDESRRGLQKHNRCRTLSRFQQLAFDMITSADCARALDVKREPRKMREQYGYTLFGQATLAARRLVEAGVRVVTVYWDEFGPANTAWDTHVNNFPRLKEGLCPTLDQVYSTLLADLDRRGMLDETAVLLVSEHGRTPKIGNKPGGAREHWSYAYNGVFAGAGFAKGQVIGTTDRQGGYPDRQPTSPKDILATLYYTMGIDPHKARTKDRLGRPHPLLPHGRVVQEMLL